MPPDLTQALEPSEPKVTHTHFQACRLSDFVFQPLVRILRDIITYWIWYLINRSHSLGSSLWSSLWIDQFPRGLIEQRKLEIQVILLIRDFHFLLPFLYIQMEKAKLEHKRWYRWFVTFVFDDIAKVQIFPKCGLHLIKGLWKKTKYLCWRGWLFCSQYIPFTFVTLLINQVS